MLLEFCSLCSPKNRNVLLTDCSIPAIRRPLTQKGMQDPVRYQKELNPTNSKAQTHEGFRRQCKKFRTFLLTLALVQRPPPEGACMSLLFWSPFFIPFPLPRPFSSPAYNIPCIHSRGHLTSFPCGKINFRLHKGKGHSELPHSWEWSLLDKKNLPLAPIFYIIW